MALIVIDVFISPSGMASNSARMSPMMRDRHADLADLALGLRMIAVVAGLRRQIEGDRKPGLPLAQILAVKRVRCRGGRMPRIGAENPRFVAARLFAHRSLHACCRTPARLMWRGFCCDATRAVCDQGQDDQHGGEADLGLDVGIDQDERAGGGEADDFACEKSALRARSGAERRRRPRARPGRTYRRKASRSACRRRARRP